MSKNHDFLVGRNLALIFSAILRILAILGVCVVELLDAYFL